MQDSASRERVSFNALIEDDTMDGEGRATQETKPRMVVPLSISITQEMTLSHLARWELS